MTSASPSRQGTVTSKQAKQLAVAATAAIPVVVLSSLAMTQPAVAAPAQAAHKAIPASAAHLSLATQVKSATQSPSLSTAVVAGTLPPRLAPTAPVVPSSHKVVAGDTVYGIAVRYGLKTSTVLALNKIGPQALIYPGQVLKLTAGSVAPIKAAAPAKATAPAAATSKATSSSRNYVVVSGDTVSGIAARHGLSLASVLAANSMTATRNTIYPGQVLKLTGMAAASAPQPAKAVASAPAKSAPAKTASGGRYVIKSGDTLSGIAAKHGVGLSALAQANNMSVNGIIYAGKTLTIPGVSTASSSVTSLAPKAPAPALVPNTFLHYTYPDAVVADANKNKAALLKAPVPSRAQMKEMVATTAAKMGIDPSLAMAFAQQESGFDQQAVSPANAIGTMQVIPAAGDWASGLVGRKLNLLNPQDNVTAGVAIIRQLLRDAPNEDIAIAGYYQGQYSVSLHGMFADTKNYVAGIKANRKLFR